MTNQAIQNVLTVTRQQQSFDSFAAADRERLHSYANFFPSMMTSARMTRSRC